MTREGIPGRAAAGKQAAARRSNRLRGRVKIPYHGLDRRATEVAGSAHPTPKILLREALAPSRSGRDKPRGGEGKWRSAGSSDGAKKQRNTAGYA